MIIRIISLRSKLILTTLILVMLLIILALIYIDASRKVLNQAEQIKYRTQLYTDFLSLRNSYYKLSDEHRPDELADLLQKLHQFNDQLGSVMSDQNIGTDEIIGYKTAQIQPLLMHMEQLLRAGRQEDPARSVQARTDMEELGSFMEEMDRDLSLAWEKSRKSRNRQMGISMALGIFLLANIMILFTMNITRSFRRLSTYTQKLSKGILPPPVDASTDDEFANIAADLNLLTADLKKKIDLIGSMSQEGLGKIFTPDAADEMGNALLVLSDFLTNKELNEVSRNRDDKKRNWISEGNAQMGEVFRTERNDVAELSFLIIQKLVNYMNMEMGALYLSNDSDPEQLSLDLVASYAYNRRKFKTMSFQWGEGLPGTCAMEKERLFITDVPADYFEVASGLGGTRPNCILLVPLKLADRLVGVMELATLKLIRPFEMEFVESLSERIASSLMAVRNSERTAHLLQQSQAQAEALKKQDAMMRENMQKLEQAQKDSSKKESEIDNILTAINQSTLVAELGLNGRFIRINEKFLDLLETQEDQVLGKLHSNFAQVDRASEEYKSFWATLKEGTSVSNTEMYILYSGREIWLQQTYTPIINEEGRVTKILNIALDITEERTLQERLRKRELEITRTGIDMQTLMQAVNNSLIKCELDAKAIIMDVNEKYCEVSGYVRNELLGRNYRLFLKDIEKEQFEKIWQEIVKEKVYEGVMRRSKPTGEEVWLISTFSPVKDETGTIYKVYFMGLDITEKRLKYQLLEEANQEIERLKSRLSHTEE